MKTDIMDNNQFPSQPGGGPVYLALSLFCATIGWINSAYEAVLGWITSAAHVKELLQNASLFISCVAGLMAIRHYYLQNKTPKA